MHVSTSYKKPDSDTERKAEADFTVKSLAETSDGILLSSAQLFRGCKCKGWAYMSEK